jgi:hypothetical protein
LDPANRVSQSLGSLRTGPTVSATDAAALSLRDRAERHVERMAGITDKVLPHLETMEPAEILRSARNLERFDFVARRNYGLEHQPNVGGPINFNILANRAAVQLVTAREPIVPPEKARQAA